MLVILYQTDFLGLIIVTKISMVFNTRSGKILAVQLKELSNCWEEEKYRTVSKWKTQLDSKPLCQHTIFMKINVNLFMLEPSKHFSLQPLNRPTQRAIARDCACSNPRLGTEPSKPGNAFVELDTMRELSLLHF